jgi:hypothetical protein
MMMGTLVDFPAIFFELAGGGKYRLNARMQQVLANAFGLSPVPLSASRWTNSAGNPTFHAIRPSADAITFLGQVTCQGTRVQRYTLLDWFNIIVHEHVHLEQEYQLGRWQFYQQYIVQYLLHGYDDHPLERVAYQYGSGPQSLANQFWLSPIPNLNLPTGTLLLTLNTLSADQCQQLCAICHQFRREHLLPNVLGK